MQPLCLTGTDFPYLVLFLSVVSLKTGVFEELVFGLGFFGLFFLFFAFLFLILFPHFSELSFLSLWLFTQYPLIDL